MRTVKLSLTLFVFWCLVAPPEGVIDLLVGVLVALLVAVWATRFLWPPEDPALASLRPGRLPRFLALTFVRVIKASLQVLRIVFDPRLPIAPELLRQEVHFEADAARSTFANAITVTPGTLTLEVEGNTFVVHCLDRALAEDVTSGRLASDVEALFGGERP
jgi:multicomponent Na+:H+ antiporter subunit E